MVKHVDGDVSGIAISPGSEVTMDYVAISNNKVEREVGAISNSGALSLKNVRIYGNTASNYSAIYNPKLKDEYREGCPDFR